MSLVFEATQTTYAVAIPTNDFLLMTRLEDEYVIPYGEFLSQKLERLPKRRMVDIDYNGHFGSAVHFTIDTEDDGPEAKSEIAALIEEHLALCRKLGAPKKGKRKRA